MKITLNNIGKRYNREWIFKNINYELTNKDSYVILGANGSGKSTLMQVIAGNILQSEGTIEYSDTRFKTQDIGHKTQDTKQNKELIESENIFNYLSFASPYMELFEEYTLTESINFHSKFKNYYPNQTTEDIIELTELEKSKDKQLKYFSSGMKQRVRLALAILSHTPLLLLDEPTSNLDKKGIEWYKNIITKFSNDRLIIIASNQQQYEYEFCNKELIIEDFKSVKI